MNIIFHFSAVVVVVVVVCVQQNLVIKYKAKMPQTLEKLKMMT